MKISTPELNNSVIGWIYRTSYESLWKVHEWHDFEDLVQDGLMIALKCRIRYGSNIDPAHFVALVKTSFTNHITSLQRKNLRHPELYIADLPDNLESLYAPELPEQEFFCTLNELPEPIKNVLRLFLSLDMLRKLRMPLRETLHDSETIAKRLKKLADWPEDKNFEVELEKLLFPS